MITPLNEAVSQISFHTEDQSFAGEITKKYPELKFFEVSGENLYNISAMGCTKANGIKVLAERFNINIANVTAFGDDFSNIEMLQYSGYRIAMENAIQAVKEFVKDICGANYEDGVAKWLEANIIKT